MGSGIYIWRAWKYFMAQTCIFCFYGLVVPIGRNTKCVLFVHYKTNPLRQVMCRLDQLSFCSSHKLCLEHFVSKYTIMLIWWYANFFLYPLGLVNMQYPQEVFRHLIHTVLDNCDWIWYETFIKRVNIVTN